MSFFFRVKEAFSNLLSEAPLLFLSFFLICGIFLRLIAFSWVFFLFFLAAVTVFFYALKLKTKLTWLFLLFTVLGYMQTWLFYPVFAFFPENEKACGLLKIHSINKSSFYKKRPVFILKGRLLSLKSCGDGDENCRREKKPELSYKNLPCTVYYPGKKGREISGSYIYAIQGRIKSKSSYYHVFKAQTMIPAKPCFSLLDLRRDLQQKLKAFLQKKLKSKSSFIFLNSQLSGSLNHNFWRFIFGKTGNSHILAISGFHFMAVVLFFSCLLKLLPFANFSSLLLFLGICAYALFVTPTAAVYRAWTAAAAAMISRVLGKNSFALNILGLGLILELAADPLNLTSISFQFSFLATAAILFLYQPFDDFLQRFLKKRNSPDLKELNFAEKTAAHIVNYLRAALAVSFAVNLCLLPLILFYFHKFPLLGLIYNLFFPVLTTLPFYLTLAALVLSPFGILDSFCFFLADKSAFYLLHLLASYPRILDFSLYFKNITWQIAVFWLAIFFFFAVLLKNRSQSALNPRPIFF